jgi:hypothetical protein
MTIPTVNTLRSIYPLMIEQYETFIPNIDGMDITQKTNSIIQYLNRIGKLNNDVVADWNKVMKWVMDEGLQDATNTKVDDLIAKGTFDDLLQAMFDNINTANTNFQNTINGQVDTLTSQMADIASKTIVYDVFPSSTTILSLANNAVFTTRGFYSKGDGFGCSYLVSTSWQANALLFGTYYVVPINQPLGELFLPYYGIRTGSSYAVSNSSVFSSIQNISFGALLRFPSGHFYFNSTIDLTSKQLKLTGAAPIGYTLDTNGNGLTWLHFPNLTNGQSAITCGTTTISNIIFYGNSNTYNLVIDRTKTVVAPDQIVTETSTATTYGIKQSGGNIDIQNCAFWYFYYGVYSVTSNSTMDNIFGRFCHFLVSMGGDTKISRIFGYNVMVVLQMRATIGTATTVRGDSIGQHLVHITNGDKIYLSNLDADYCVKSIIHLGDGNWGAISGLFVDGIHGRSNTYRAYDSTLGSEPTSANITTSANIEEYPLISVNKQTNVYSSKFIIMGKGNFNPMDGGTGSYLTPSILLAADVSTVVQNVELSIVASLSSGDTTPLTSSWVTNRLKTLSGNARNLEVSVKTAFDTLYYKQNGVNVAITKPVVQDA